MKLLLSWKFLSSDETRNVEVFYFIIQLSTVGLYIISSIA